MVATPDDVVWARTKFNRSPKNKRCEPVIWEDPDEGQHYITYSDTVRTKLLKIVANADASNNTTWLRRVVMDSEEEEHVRLLGNQLIKSIEGKSL